MKLKKWLAILLAATLVLSAMPDQRWTVSAEETEQGQETEELEKSEGEESSGEDERAETSPTADDEKKRQEDLSIGEEQATEKDLSTEEQTPEKDLPTGSPQDLEKDPESEGNNGDLVTDPSVEEKPDSIMEEDEQEKTENPEEGEALLEQNTVLKKSNALQTASPAEGAENSAQEELEEPEVINELSERDEAGEPAAQAGDIASGTDGNINWVIDADGKLTVNGRGDFSSSPRPWDSYREQIISAEVHITGMTDASSMFNGCYNLSSLDVDNFDTTNVTNMSGMFWGCSSLSSLNVNNFDTANVTDMSYMFRECNNLNSLDLGGFDTVNVTDMSGMFWSCSKLSSLNVSNFNTSSITDMSSMFRSCSSLSSLDVSNFNTSNVTNMEEMFGGCSNLRSLNVSNFDTSDVVDMGAMFLGCSSLNTLDLGNFDTSNVTDMGLMFRVCSSLSTLDLGNFDTSNVANMGAMFLDCSSLSSLDLGNFDTSSVTDMSSMFAHCTNLKMLDLSSFNTANVTSMGGMFDGCSNLNSLDLSSFNTANVTNMSSMFMYCSALNSIDVSNFNTSNVTTMSMMFNFCESLNTIDVSNFNTVNVTNMNLMFDACSSLTELDVSSFDTSNVTDMLGMFAACSSLNRLDVSNFNTINVTDMTNMFRDCSSLDTLDMSSFNIANVTKWFGMFKGCVNLATIYTPYSINITVELPIEEGECWRLSDGTEITRLPKGLSNSVMITKYKNPKIITTTPDLNMSDVIRVKYVPYSYTVETNNWDETNKVTYSLVSGKLAEGLNLYPDTGEIYGIPLEAGEFPIRVKAEFSNPEYLPSYADLTLTVLDNSDDNVFVASDPGYEVEQYLGTQIFSAPGSSDYYYAVQERSDQLFVSAGENGEFIALWLNGKKLTEGEDFTRESGSTRITVRSQTLENKTNKNGTNTIAAEFRVGGNPQNDLKRTAQNFRIDFQDQGGSSRNGRSGSSGSGDGSSSEEVNAISSLATAIVRLVDAAGKPLADTTLELHSTPQTAQTNQNGIAVFGGVPEGVHTLYAKDENGNILASRSFELLFGTPVSLNGDQITAKAGAAFTFQVQMEGNELKFLSVYGGDVYQVISANTGDQENPWLWLMLLLISGSMVCGLFYRKQKQSSL